MSAAADPLHKRRRLIAVIGGVVGVHMALLMLVRGGFVDRAQAQRPADKVVAVQLVSQGVAPLPAVPDPSTAPTAATTHSAVNVSAPSKPLPSPLPPPLALPLSISAASTGNAPAQVSSGEANAASAMPQATGHTTAAASATITTTGVAPPHAGTGSTNNVAASTNSARVDLPSSDADYLHNPKPEYPRLSRQRNEEGKVIVNVLIGVDGAAQKAEVKVSSGFERLDQAALATAKMWRYVPGKRGGVPEPMWFAVPISFVMD